MAEIPVPISFVAALVQFLTDIVKCWLPEFVLRNIKPLISAGILEIAIALVLSLDFFVAAGYDSNLPIVTQIVTGIAISAGFVGIHELASKLRSSRTDLN